MVENGKGGKKAFVLKRMRKKKRKEAWAAAAAVVWVGIEERSQGAGSEERSLWEKMVGGVYGGGGFERRSQRRVQER